MDAKVIINSKDDYDKIKVWADENEKGFISSYDPEMKQLVIEQVINWCGSLCEHCECNKSCNGVNMVLLSVDEFLKWKEEAKQLVSDEPKFKLGDEVWIKGLITVGKDSDNTFKVHFLNYKGTSFHDYLLEDQISKSIPDNKKESQDLVYDLYQKIISLTKENEKLKQVVFAKETLDQSKEIKQIINSGKTPKASIMINSEKSIDLSEIDDDQYILRGNY